MRQNAACQRVVVSSRTTSRPRRSLLNCPAIHNHCVRRTMVTSRLFEAFLACPTKCFLRSIGQSATENTFTSWREARDEWYRREGFKRLSAELPWALDPVSVERRKLKNAR